MFFSRIVTGNQLKGEIEGENLGEMEDKATMPGWNGPSIGYLILAPMPPSVSYDFYGSNCILVIPMLLGVVRYPFLFPSGVHSTQYDIILAMGIMIICLCYFPGKHNGTQYWLCNKNRGIWSGAESGGSRNLQ